MKNRFIAILIGILIGFVLFTYNLYEKKIKQVNEMNRIEKQIKFLEEKNKEEFINKEKEKILKKILKEGIKNNKQVKDKKLEKKENDNKNIIKSTISVTVYNYNNLFKQIYDKIVNNDKVKKQIGYKSFKETRLYNRLEELKKQLVHTKVKFLETGKELNFEYLIIDIDCNGFCKKTINREINNVYKLDNSILTKIDYKKQLTENELIDFLKSEKSFYNYFNKK